MVKFRAKDQAGNESVAEKTVTVNAPPSRRPRDPGRRRTPDDPGTPNDRPDPDDPAPGDGRLASVQVGGVTVLVPKRVRLGRIKQLALGARADQAGRLTLRLVRNGKVYSRLTVGLAPGETSQQAAPAEAAEARHLRREDRVQGRGRRLVGRRHGEGGVPEGIAGNGEAVADPPGLGTIITSVIASASPRCLVAGVSGSDRRGVSGAQPAALAGDPLTSIKINEVESDGAADFIELINISATATDVSGLVLKDNDDSRTLAIPGGTSIAAGGFLAVDTDVPGGFGLGRATPLASSCPMAPR